MDKKINLNHWQLYGDIFLNIQEKRLKVSKSDINMIFPANLVFLEKSSSVFWEEIT
jgi:hypothetical protein